MYSSAHFGEGTGPIFMTDLECSGSESNLFNCSHTSPSTAYSHSEDAGVRCSPCEFFSPICLFLSDSRNVCISNKMFYYIQCL